MLEISGICIGPWVGQLVVRGREVRLGPLEHRLLLFLMRNANTLLSTEVIIAEIWGNREKGSKTTSSHLVSMHIRSLRRAIEEDPSKPELILCHYGLGYVFVDRDFQSKQTKGEETLSVAGIELDKKMSAAKIRGREVALTAIEFRLLELLMKNAGETCEDRLLEDAAHGNLGTRGRGITSLMHNLREKLGDTNRRIIIERVWNAGYRFRLP